jgi:hypothetical protein
MSDDLPHRVIDLTVERHDALELTLARAAYRDVLDALAHAAAFAAIDDFLG